MDAGDRIKNYEIETVETIFLSIYLLIYTLKFHFTAQAYIDFGGFFVKIEPQ